MFWAGPPSLPAARSLPIHALSTFTVAVALATGITGAALAHTGLAPAGVVAASVGDQSAQAAGHPGLAPAARAALPEVTRRRLEATVGAPGMPPVLLPSRVALLETAEAVVGSGWHAVSMHDSDYSVYVHASAAAIEVPGIRRPPVRPPSLAVPRISRTHEIVTAHFVAWGVAWDVDIECLGGLDHPLCGDDVLVHELIRSLRRLAGPR
jgi:hypothetical protein